MTNDLRGFSDWRTRPEHYHEPSRNGARRCAQCNAVLRKSNPTDRCAPCAGVRLPEDIPSWMIELAETGPTGITSVARLLAQVPTNRAARDAAIMEHLSRGKSQSAVGEIFGLSRAGIEDIARRQKEQAAIADYLGGMSQNAVGARHGIGSARITALLQPYVAEKRARRMQREEVNT